MSKRSIAGNCYTLDINHWVRHGKLKLDTFLSGHLVWNYNNGWRTAMAYEVSTCDEPFIRLSYSCSDGHTESYRIRLTISPASFGGVRWWFICPAGAGEQPCYRRVAKLYMPRRSTYFGCRQCHKLTYVSCQESHMHEALWRKLFEKNTDEDLRMMKKAMTEKKPDLLPTFS